jgi:hypothetical protein
LDSRRQAGNCAPIIRLEASWKTVPAILPQHFARISHIVSIEQNGFQKAMCEKLGLLEEKSIESNP